MTAASYPARRPSLPSMGRVPPKAAGGVNFVLGATPHPALCFARATLPTRGREMAGVSAPRPVATLLLKRGHHGE